MTKRIRSKISRGSAELAILALLAEQPLYGFEICKRIEEKTAGALSFTLASLYPMLYDLEKRGSIAGRWEANHAGRDRRVYTSLPLARKNWPRCAGNGISFSRLSIASRGLPMPDNVTNRWIKLVREHLLPLDLPANDREEIVSELAAHLEDLYEEKLGQGISEREAAEAVANEVVRWRSLATRIQRAKLKEEIMNDRTKHFWLPGLVSLTLAMILLAPTDLDFHAAALSGT